MPNTHPSPTILFSALLALGCAAPALSAEDKGVQKCPDNQICFAINPPAAQSSAVDVSVQYRYSGPQGTGKENMLDNGATLKTGDKFTISLQAQEPRYVYLFHFDSSGQLNELLSLSGKRNQVTAGSKLTLPAPDQHFLLDNKIGVETIHTIVSKKELTNLRDKYQAILNGKPEQRPMLTVAANQDIVRENKGLCVRFDKNSPPCPDGLPVAKPEPSAPQGQDKQNKPVLRAQGSRTLVCQGGEACRDSFTIQHVAR